MFFREKKLHIRCNFRFHTNCLSFFQFLKAGKFPGTDSAQIVGSVRCSSRHVEVVTADPAIFLYFLRSSRTLKTECRTYVSSVNRFQIIPIPANAGTPFDHRWIA